MQKRSGVKMLDKELRTVAEDEEEEPMLDLGEDGTDVVIDEVDGVWPNDFGSVQIFPNPVHDQVTVVDAPRGAILKVMTLDGKAMVETMILGRTVLDASSWQQGLYLVNIQSEQGQLTQRLVVTR